MTIITIHQLIIVPSSEKDKARTGCKPAGAHELTSGMDFDGGGGGDWRGNLHTVPQ